MTYMSRPREFDVERALRQSMEIFWTKGFKSTSFDDLTDATQVKKQSLYCVFKDKRALFLKALALYREQSLAAVEQLASQDDLDPWQKLERLRDAMLSSCIELHPKGCLVVNSMLEFGNDDEEVKREVELMQVKSERIFETILRQGQELELITVRYTSAELAAYLNNAFIGAKVMEKSGISRERIDAVLRTTYAMLAP